MLTPKQRRFCEEYVVDFNATQAATRAGYDCPKTTGADYYVYLLTDSNSGNIFYIGKGKGDRYKHHFANYRKLIIDNAPKQNAIHKIIMAGGRVEVIFLESELPEDAALNIEKYLITQLFEFGLSNIAHGSASGLSKSKIWAQAALSKIIPFERWSKGRSDYEIDMYHRIVAEIKNIAMNGCPGSLHFENGKFVYAS